MPELPEVEVLVRHLAPLLHGKLIRAVKVRRPRVIRPHTPKQLESALRGSKFSKITRRGKYLLFQLERPKEPPLLLLGHLGMTGRMYLLDSKAPLPRHAAVVFALNQHQFVLEDTRYFGRLTLDARAIELLGPEPLSPGFTPEGLHRALKRSRQPIKIKLLDQRLVAGIGNIYASEALFRAGISPRVPARNLTRTRVKALWQAIRDALEEAIRFGSTVPLNLAGTKNRDGLFYYGRAEESSAAGYEERLQVYDRRGKPCLICGTPVRHLTQAARSTYFCPQCQK